jgi:hypothetical protein
MLLQVDLLVQWFQNFLAWRPSCDFPKIPTPLPHFLFEINVTTCTRIYIIAHDQIITILTHDCGAYGEIETHKQKHLMWFLLDNK